MGRRRAVLVVLAGMGIAAGYLWTSGASEPIRLAAAPPTAAGAAPSAPAATASTVSAAGLPASGAAGVVTPRSDDLPDFGQLVLSGLYGGTGKAAAIAAGLLSLCADIQTMPDKIEAKRLQGEVSNEQSAEIAARTQKTIGRCQSITSDMQGYRAALARYAIDAGAKDVSTVYAEALHYAPSDAERALVQDALKADAARGNPIALSTLALHGRELGLSNVDIAAYLQMLPSGSADWTASLQRATVSLTPDEQAQANALAAQLKSTWKPVAEWRPGE